MNKIKIMSILIALLLLFGCATMGNGYQDNSDKIRLEHLRYYGDLLNEYYEIEGKYPFQEKYDVPVYITIANEFQEKNANQQLPFEHKKISTEQFEKELEKVLKTDITLKYDPQKVGVYAPNFYIYNVYQKVFYFAIHLYNENDFSNNIGKHYNKMELTNNQVLNKGQIHYDKLCQIVKHPTEKPTAQEFDLHTDIKKEELIQNSFDGLIKNQSIQAKEIFIGYNSKSDYLRIKEYKLSSTNEDLSNIDNQVLSIKNQIQSKQYSANRFSFSNWISIEENMFKDREIVTSTIDFLTKDKDSVKVLTDCFEKILNRPVRLVSTKNLTSLSFISAGIKCGSSNGSVFHKDGITLIMWDNLLNDFNIIFNDECEIRDDLSFFSYFGEDAESPRKSEEEIKNLRDE